MNTRAIICLFALICSGGTCFCHYGFAASFSVLAGVLGPANAGGPPLIDLDIDSDNSGLFDAPTGDAWEERIEASGFGTGKLVQTGAAQFTPVVIRVRKRAIEKFDGGKHSIENVRVKFTYDGSEGLVRLWRGPKAVDSRDPPRPIRAGRVFSLKELGFDHGTETATIWIEAIKAAAGIHDKAAIDKNGRPDMFLVATLVDQDRLEIASDKVRCLPVDPGSFLPLFVAPANRHIRNAVAAMLVNGSVGKKGGTSSLPPSDSKAYGFRAIPENELMGLLNNSKLSEPQKRFIIEVLYYKLSSFEAPSRKGLRGLRAGLYCNYSTGEYTLVFQHFPKDKCSQLFSALSPRYFELKAGDHIHRRVNASFLSSYLGGEEFGVNLPELEIAGNGYGGDLAISGALASGIPADTFSTKPIPEEMLKITLTRIDGKQEARIELVPDSIQRLVNARDYISGFTLEKSPFLIEQAPFPIVYKD